jgi:hypothetical protein
MDLPSFALGFAAGLTVMGLAWLYFDIKRVLNAPQKLAEEILASLRAHHPIKSTEA